MTGTKPLARHHAAIAFAAFALFAGLTLAATRSPAYAAGVVLGPAAGGVARAWQSCCARDSRALAPWAVGVALAGLVVQLVIAPTTRVRANLRTIAWALATASWFASADLSYGRALE